MLQWADLLWYDKSIIYIIEYNARVKLKCSRMCKNEALTKFDTRENILLYSSVLICFAQNYNIHKSLEHCSQTLLKPLSLI